MKILIYGIGGKMGKILADRIYELKRDEVIGGVDEFSDGANCKCPVYKNIAEYTAENDTPDCIIDFSSHTAVYDYLPYAVKNKIPCVIAATGQTAEDENYILKSSEKTPIYKSGNMSIGISLLLKLVTEAEKFLGPLTDVEIVETHHRRKKDSPSGTALMIAKAIQAVATDTNLLLGRKPEDGQRKPGEIGISSIRGGTVAGTHEVKFLLDNEVITVSHNAEDRTIFADGSLRAAHFIQNKENGLYNEMI